MSIYDVAVVGRGAIGLTAALAFARAGRRVALVGPEPTVASAASALALAPAPAADPLAWDSRVYALSPASRKLLTALGAWQLMDPARLAPVHDMRIFHRHGGAWNRPDVHLDAYRGHVEALAWIVENRQLQGALERSLALTVSRETLVHVHAEVEGLTLPSAPHEPGAATLSLRGGGRLTAALVVAADGIASRLRELAGIDHEVRDLRQTAVVANFETSRPHRDCAWQWFGVFGVVALLPLASDDLGYGRGRVSLVWAASPDGAARALREPPALVAAEVQAMTEGRLGELRPITPPGVYPLRSVRCREVIKPSFVLIGDAAHAIHPMAGQGMNLGFGDVGGLVEHVIVPGSSGRSARAPDWFDLRRYERSRREPVAVMQLALEGLHRAFGDLPAPLAGLRDVGWTLVARSSWLRRRMIEHAVS